MTPIWAACAARGLIGAVDPRGNDLAARPALTSWTQYARTRADSDEASPDRRRAALGAAQGRLKPAGNPRRLEPAADPGIAPAIHQIFSYAAAHRAAN